MTFNRILGRKILFVLFLSVFSLFNNISANTERKKTIESKYPINLLRDDFKLAYSLLKELHPALDLYRSNSDFDKIYEMMLSGICEPKTGREFYYYIASLLDSVHCCHTFADLPQIEYDDVHKKEFLPFDVKIYEKRIFIHRCLDTANVLEKGTEILKINGIAAEEILERGKAFLSIDGRNSRLKYQQMANNFKLHYYKYFGKCETVRLELKNKDNGSFSVEIKCPTLERINQIDKMEAPKPIEYSIFRDVCLLKIRTFSKYDIELSGIDYKNLFARLIEETKVKNVKNLIIDLRENDGGDPDITIPLLSRLIIQEFQYHKKIMINNYRFSDNVLKFTNLPEEYRNPDILGALVKKEGKKYVVKPNKIFPSTIMHAPENNVFNGDIYVLTDSQVMSAASDFLSILKNYRKVTIIGDETGGAEFGQSSGVLLTSELPNSKVKIMIPMALCYNASNAKPGHGITPDYKIIMKAEDYLMKKDPVMDKALILIEHKRNNSDEK